MPDKRKGSPYYWYDFSVRGQRYRGSTETSDFGIAQAIEAKLRHDIIQQAFLKKKPVITLNDAAVRYWEEYAKYLKSGHQAIKYHLLHICKIVGKAALLSDLSDADIARYKAKRRGTVADSTVNREMSTFRGILNKSILEWGYDVATINWAAHWLDEPENRTRWESPETIDRIVECAAPHLKFPIRFAVYTGVRSGNILSCRKEDLNFLKRRITLRVKSKLPGGRLHTVYMTDLCYNMLIKEMGVKHGDKGPLFTYMGKPIGKFRRSWATACRLAGVEDFHFHDLRHTCASWLIQNGTPVELVQQILGHKDIKTTMKYAHHREDAAGDYMDNAMAQIRHNRKNDEIRLPSNPLIKMVGTTGFEPATPSPPERLSTKSKSRRR